MKLLTLAFFLSTMLLTAGDVSGHWSGNFELKSPDGETRTPPVYLILKQDGNTVTGSGGETLEDRHEITKGTIEGNKVVLDVQAGGGGIHLEFTVDGDQLNGEARRTHPDGHTQTAKLTAKRVSDAK